MSVATATAEGTPGAAFSDGPGIGRLAAIELRKIRDTRAGKWLLGLSALFAIGFVAVVLLVGEGDDRTLAGLISGSALGVSMLPPVLAILAITSEWSQRTGLTTFALVPSRGRVIGAKLIATTVLALATAALAIVAAAVGSVLTGEGAGPDPAVAIGQMVLFQLLFVTMGAAFGLAFQSSPVAIVLYFLVPGILSALGGLIAGIRDAVEWIDPNTAWTALVTPPAGGEDWGPVVVSALLMIGLPLAVGLVRLTRSEIK